jgi:hypothetical protein
MPMPRPAFAPTFSRRALFAGLAALAALPLAAADLAPEDPLAEHLWTSRPIIVFATSERDPRFIRQMAEIEKAREQLEERDVVVITDTEPGPSRFDTTELRKKFRPHDFNLILVGKDGEVKKRSPRVVSGAQLVRQIDRLPLRQQEMGRR